MKTDVHPDYVDCKVTCGCGHSFETKAVMAEMKVDICSSCHPFFTGTEKLLDTEGRIERFNKKYKKAKA